jgi:hypothetical protein
MDEKVYRLKYPVKVGEHYCEELRFTRPKTKDFIAVGNAPLETAESIALILASVTGEPFSVISQLDIDDLSVLRLEAIRMYNSYIYTTPYEVNPTPPPQPEAEAETKETAEANA